jgi:hypothetical protein
MRLNAGERPGAQSDDQPAYEFSHHQVLPVACEYTPKTQEKRYQADCQPEHNITTKTQRELICSHFDGMRHNIQIYQVISIEAQSYGAQGRFAWVW